MSAANLHEWTHAPKSEPLRCSKCGSYYADPKTPADCPGGGFRVFYVADFAGKVAATRHLGREVADHITRVAKEADPALIEVNFSGVEVATPPFLQEVVRSVRALRDGAIYSCLNQDVSSVLTLVENKERDDA